MFIFRKLGSDVYNGDELTWDVSLYKAGNRGDRVKLCHISSSSKTTWFLQESRWPFFFFFLSLNHVAIACYLQALVKNLTLQTIGGNVSRLMKLTCPDPKKEKVKVKPDQSRNSPYNVPEPLSLSGCPKLFSFFFNLYLHRGEKRILQHQLKQ